MSTPKSVSQLVFEIKDILEGTFRNVLCTGEISNLSASSAGHYYFNLSDKDASVSCALFKMDAFRNPLIRTIKNGDKVIIAGPISVYAKRGSFQILVKKIVKSGKGTLLEQYNTLKTKLNSEGLFNLDAKKAIPRFAKKIAVITGNNSAALADFINVFERRALLGELIIIPTLVQGDKSESSLLNSLEKAQRIKGLDIIVFTRGGGSMEDLWSFNSEQLARKIFESEIPVISAIGHQVDYTICDYVSDLRVETPTAAAETITQKQVELKDRLLHSKKALSMIIKEKLNDNRQLLYNFSPFKNINRINGRLNSYKNKLEKLNIKSNPSRLLKVDTKTLELDELHMRLGKSLEYRMLSTKSQVNTLGKQLQGLNPKNILMRGYSILRSNSEVVKSKKDFKKKSSKDLSIEFHDGTVDIKRN